MNRFIPKIIYNFFDESLADVLSFFSKQLLVSKVYPYLKEYPYLQIFLMRNISFGGKKIMWEKPFFLRNKRKHNRKLLMSLTLGFF
jgi:hypothetical protein